MWIYTRVAHSITFKLTDFVWELSTVLHVELDLIEDITTTQGSYKFLPMWRKKEDEVWIKHVFILVTAIFGILECDWLKDVDEWGADCKTGKQPRSKIYIDLPVCNNFLFTRMALLLNGFQ